MLYKNSDLNTISHTQTQKRQKFLRVSEKACRLQAYEMGRFVDFVLYIEIHLIRNDFIVINVLFNVHSILFTTKLGTFFSQKQQQL